MDQTSLLKWMVRREGDFPIVIISSNGGKEAADRVEVGQRAGKTRFCRLTMGRGRGGWNFFDDGVPGGEVGGGQSRGPGHGRTGYNQDGEVFKDGIP